jgi:hypothetical protein
VRLSEQSCAQTQCALDAGVQKSTQVKEAAKNGDLMLPLKRGGFAAGVELWTLWILLRFAVGVTGIDIPWALH